MNFDNSDEPTEMRTPSIKGDVTERIAKVSRFFADAIVRNMPTETRGSGCPVIVELLIENPGFDSDDSVLQAVVVNVAD